MRYFLLRLIQQYQRHISPRLGANCRFTPTCSEYAYTVISRFGVLRGGWLALLRMAKCGPWHPGGYDPAPPLLP